MVDKGGKLEPLDLDLRGHRMVKIRDLLREKTLRGRAYLSSGKSPRGLNPLSEKIVIGFCKLNELLV